MTILLQNHRFILIIHEEDLVIKAWTKVN